LGVVIENTPNPNALKFTVGNPVGGPATFTDAATADDRVAPILELEGVVSVFMTANFVTVTRLPTADWEYLAQPISDILERTFG
jgi:NFU1 iron-sulfur cluster scaffold homolog, mitochondrial